MPKLFDPKTGKLYDLTTGDELIYQPDNPSDCYDKAGSSYYQIAQHQLIVEDTSMNTMDSSAMAAALAESDSFEFSLGFQLGLTHGFMFQSRKAFAKAQYVTWSYLVGYEYGVQLGAYYASISDMAKK